MESLYPIIEDWSIVKGFKVYGKIYDHTTIKDGSLVTTSTVKEAYLSGFINIIVTEDAVFRVGEVSKMYKDWLEKNGYGYDPLFKIKVIRT